MVAPLAVPPDSTISVPLTLVFVAEPPSLTSC